MGPMSQGLLHCFHRWVLGGRNLVRSRRNLVIRKVSKVLCSLTWEGRPQGDLAVPGLCVTGGLGKGFKGERYQDCGKRTLGMYLMAETKHHPTSTTRFCRAPFCWELQALSHVPLLSISPVLK